MNALNFLIEQWIPHLWAVSWQVSILFVIIWIVDRLSFRASSLFRYSLWLIVLVRLCIPVNLTLPGGLGHVIMENIGIGLPHLRSLMVKSNDADGFGFQELSPSLADDMTGNHTTIEPVEDAASNTVYNIAGIVWLVSVGVICVFILYRIIRISRSLRLCEPVKRKDICLLFQRLKEDFGLNHDIGLYYMDIDNVNVPAVIGVFHPRIFLPPKIADEWSVEDIEPVLLHELAHIKRHDHIVNFLQVIIQVVYFFHPIVWIANHRIRKLREQLSDDLALYRLGLESKRYSMSILSVMENDVKEPAFNFIGIGFLERKSLIGERIKRIMDTNYRNRTNMKFLSIVMVIVIGMVGFFFSCERTSVNTKEVVIPPEIVIDSNVMTNDKKEAVSKAMRGIASDEHIDLHINIATAKSDKMQPPEELNQSLERVVEEVKKYSYITVESYKNIPLDSSELLKVPLLFISADEAFELTQMEAENLGNYLRSGGFVFIDNGTPEIEFSEAEASLRQLLRDALKSDAKFLPIPNSHPLYHCYIDFDDGPPGGIVPEMDIMQPYLEGIWFEDRLVAVYSDRGYIYKWLDTGNNEPQLRFGVNLVVFAALQRDGMLERFSRLNDQSPVKVMVPKNELIVPKNNPRNAINVFIPGNGEYKFDDKTVASSDLLKELQQKMEENKGKTIVIHFSPFTHHGDIQFFMKVARSAGIEAVGVLTEQGTLISKIQTDQSSDILVPKKINLQNMVSVVITENGEYKVGGKIIVSSDLLKVLMEEKKKKDSNSIIIIKTPQTRDEDVSFVENIAQNAGIEFVFVGVWIATDLVGSEQKP